MSDYLFVLVILVVGILLGLYVEWALDCLVDFWKNRK